MAGVSDALPVCATGSHMRGIGALLPPHPLLPSPLAGAVLRLEPELLLALLQGLLVRLLLPL